MHPTPSSASSSSKAKPWAEAVAVALPRASALTMVFRLYRGSPVRRA